MGCFVERTKDASMMGRFCTLILMGMWILEICALALAHQGISAVIPVMRDLPDNIVDGFNTQLGIGELKSGMETVQEEAEKVLVKCKVVAPLAFESACEAIEGGTDPTNPTATDTAVADTEKAAIQQAFDDGLDKATKVVNDDYFGKPEMAAAAEGLNNITAQLADARTGDAPCLAQNKAYCGMRKAAVSTLGQVDTVNDAIKGLTEAPAWVTFEESVSPLLPVLHAVPYVGVLSLALFTFVWASDGGLKTKVAYGFHLFLALVGIVIAAVVVGLNLAFGAGADRIKVPDGVLAKDGATVEILKEHIKTEFNELWVVIFVPFGDAGTKLGNAFMVFLAVAIISIIYGMLFCCIKPYKKKAAEGETAK